MKKYVDYATLHYTGNDNIKEERENIVGWIKWLIFFSIISVLSVLPVFFFDVGALILMFCVTLLSLFGVFVSLVFIAMYKVFIRSWEKFNYNANKIWQDLEDKHNKEWNEYFEKWRSSSYCVESQVKKNEQNIINHSIQHVKNLLMDRK